MSCENFGWFEWGLFYLGAWHALRLGIRFLIDIHGELERRARS